MRNAIRISIVASVILSTWLLCRPAVAQNTESSGAEQILDYHSDIRVRQDAPLLVRETIRVHSAGIKIHHGIYRDFPTRYQEPDIAVTRDVLDLASWAHLCCFSSSGRNHRHPFLVMTI